MTESDVENEKAKATLAVVNQQKVLNAANLRFEGLKAEIEKILKDIHNKNAFQIAELTFEACVWWKSDVIKGIARDVVLAQSELAKVTDEANQIGAVVPDTCLMKSR